MNVKFVSPGDFVRVFRYEDGILPVKRIDHPESFLLMVDYNEPISSTRSMKAGRRLVFTNGQSIQVNTMADLVVE